ncbi:MAG: hypothetical protein WCO57_05590 [Verrucomicrobiota bacterium]
MNPSALNELIDTIQSLLDDRPTSATPDVVAQEYARMCREVNERLGRIGLMLEEGGEIQALQLAEQPPRVLDAAITLSFGRESEWLEYCRNHGHEVPPMIDARTLDVLQGIQAKGVTPNHPLYRDYRAAVSSKNEGKAFELIRIIHHLNPADENAGREFKRLRHKLFLAVLAEIREALAGGGHEAVLAAMPRVEQLGDPEEYENLAEWRKSLAIRHRQRADEALLRMPTLLLKAEEQMESGDWHAAAVAYGEFTQLSDAFCMEGQTSEMIGRTKKLEGQLATHRAEANRVARVNGLVAELLQLAKGVEARATIPMGLTTEFATPLLVECALKLRQIEDLHGALPEAALAHIEAASATLTLTVERARASLRRKKTAVIAVVATVALAATGYGFLAHLANQRVATLSELRSKDSSAGLRELLDKLDGKEAFLLKFSSLTTVAAEARQWLERAELDAKAVDREIVRLEKIREAAFSGASPLELQQKLEEAEALVAKLPDDYRKPAETRLSVVKNDATRNLKRQQVEANQRACETVEHWTQVLEKVDYAASVSVAKDAVSGSEAVFTPLLALSNNKQAILRLPPTTETQVSTTSERLMAVREQVGNTEAALAMLAQAANSDDYRTALATLASSRFKEAVMAKAALDAWPRDERIKAFLIFRNDLSAFRDASKEELSSVPYPAAATKQDRETIGELTNCQPLNELWEVIWKNKEGINQTWLSKGPLKAGEGPSWAGKMTSSAKRPTSNLKFSDLIINESKGVKLISNRILPASEMMENLQLPLLLDDTGGEYRASVLPLVDRVTNAKDVDPLARAYVLARLFRLIRAQGIAWGVHYCPELLDDMNVFAGLEMKWPLSEGSWLVKEKPVYAKHWEAYFAGRENRSFFDIMKKMKAAAGHGIKNQIALAGRVGIDGTVTLVPSKASRLVMGIGNLHPQESGLCIAGIVDSTSDKLKSPIPLVPFSPVLCIDMPAEDQLFIQSIHVKDLNQPATTPRL